MTFLGNKKSLGFTIIETLCVIVMIAITASFLTPVFVAARNRAKLARSMSNMRQIHAALVVYCDNQNGSLSDLPPGVFPLQLPKEILHTGGISVIPTMPHSDVYRFVWPQGKMPDPYIPVWNRYVAATEGNPVLVIDETFPNSDVEGPFVKKSRYGIFWHGEIRHRRYGGTSENLMENWR